MERAKARAAVAIASQKLRVGLQKQMPADNNRPCQQTGMYEKEMVAVEKKTYEQAKQSKAMENVVVQTDARVLPFHNP